MLMWPLPTGLFFFGEEHLCRSLQGHLEAAGVSPEVQFQLARFKVCDYSLEPDALAKVCPEDDLEPMTAAGVSPLEALKADDVWEEVGAPDEDENEYLWAGPAV